MDREKLLKLAKTEEDKLFLAKLIDKANQADRGYITTTHFMDPHQRSIARRALREMGVQSIFDGGYLEAERALCIFLPDYMVYGSEADTLENMKNSAEYPICLIRVDFQKNPYAKELTHRDCLGAIMNLGIKRETVGDILVHEGFAQVLVLSDIATYLENNLRQIARVSVDAKTADLSELALPDQNMKEKTATVASLRLDAVVAEGFQISRSKASEYIEAGKVYLQFEECNNAYKQVEEGNFITLRGLGRIMLSQIGGTSKKNRIFITIKRFI